MSTLVAHASLHPHALGSNILEDYVLWRWGTLHDAAGWARRNVPVFIGGSVGPVCWAAPLGPPRVRPAGKGRLVGRYRPELRMSLLTMQEEGLSRGMSCPAHCPSSGAS